MPAASTTGHDAQIDLRVLFTRQLSLLGSYMGRMMREYFLPLLASFQFTEYLKHTPDVPDSDVTPEYCARHNWLVGSPATVARRGGSATSANARRPRQDTITGSTRRRACSFPHARSEASADASVSAGDPIAVRIRASDAADASRSTPDASV